MPLDDYVTQDGAFGFSIQGKDTLDKLIEGFSFTRKEYAAISAVGIPFVEKAFKDNVPYNTDSYSRVLYGYDIGHLRDHITSKKNATIDGAAFVGIDSKAYPLAVWTDWGTYRQPAQFWFENKVVPEIDYEGIFAAQQNKVMEILGSRYV